MRFFLYPWELYGLLMIPHVWIPPLSCYLAINSLCSAPLVLSSPAWEGAGTTKFWQGRAKRQWREYNACAVVRSGHRPLPVSEVIGAPEQTCPMQSRPSSVASLQCMPQRCSARQDLVRFCTPVWPHFPEHSLHFDHGDKNLFGSCTSGPWITSVVCYWDAYYTYGCPKTGSCFLSSFYIPASI